MSRNWRQRLARVVDLYSGQASTCVCVAVLMKCKNSGKATDPGVSWNKTQSFGLKCAGSRASSMSRRCDYFSARR